VKRGKVSVVGDDGKVVFATLGSGCVFGEVSLYKMVSEGFRTINDFTFHLSTGEHSEHCRE